MSEQNYYVVVRLEAETEKFSDVEGVYTDKSIAEQLITDDKKQWYSHRYEWKIVELYECNVFLKEGE